MKNLLFVCILASGLALYLSNGPRPEAERQECERNLRDIALRIEMYSSDGRGLYPKNLQAAVNSVNLKIPTCPSAGYDTYSSTYESTAHPDAFTIACGGKHHGSTKLIYVAEFGLIRK